MVRQSIVDSIVKQMQKISSANGFYSEAGKNVYEWYSKPLGEGEYPAIIIRDVSDSALDGGTLQHTLKIEIDIAIKGKDTVWNMREVTSDVLKAFGKFEDETNYQSTFNSSEFLTEQKDTLYGGVRLEFDVVYYTNRWEQ